MKRNWDVMRLILTTMERQVTAEFQLYPADFAPVEAMAPMDDAARALRALGDLAMRDGHLPPGVPPSLGQVAAEDFQCLMGVLASHTRNTHRALLSIISSELARPPQPG